VQRRHIENGLFEGDLLGVVATSALELGIDVGGIDAVISATFPGTVASLWQQWGRAGRGTRPSLAVYMAGQDALDQFFALHPDELLERDVESAILDFENEQIYAAHLGAAAYEAPLRLAAVASAPEPEAGTPAGSDERFLGPGMETAARELAHEGKLRERDGRFSWARPGFPAERISLRSSSPDSFSIVVEDTGTVLGQVEAERAFVFVHPGAIYMHLGETYQVRGIDLGGRVAVVRPILADYYTQPKKDTSVDISERLMVRPSSGTELSFGKLMVTERVIAYQKKSLSDNQVMEMVELDLPKQTFLTEGLWFPLGDNLLEELEPPDLLGALHATEHGLIAMLPLFAMCDRWDIGGLSIDYHWQLDAPAIFVYDGHPGGIGLGRKGFLSFEELVSASHKLISSCPCEAGCPSCIQSPKCGNLNEPLSKWGAINVLGKMMAVGAG
jgi:DEAD/DEAH box helicase domain-containing protein